jgi:Lon protease-like protein
MSTFEDLSYSVENFSGRVRLFPLPNLVLFPHVMQPVHIFEPRYRDMLEDALAADRLIAAVLLAPGWETNYEGRPAMYPIACLGRIASHVRLGDGTHNVLLLGLRRIKLLNELQSMRHFREAEVEIREDYYPPRKNEQYQLLTDRLLKAFLKIVPFLPEAEDEFEQLTEADIPLGMLTDIISFMLDIDLRKKQSLLAETDVPKRAKLLLKYLAAAAEVIENHGFGTNSFPPLFSSN